MRTRSWRGVGLVTGWQLVASLCFYAIFAATAFVRDTFGVSRTLVGVAVTAVIVGYTALLFVAGGAVDGYGERPVMVGGLAALGVGMLAVAVAPTYPVLLLALVGVGAMYATAMPATNRAVLAVSPEGQRNLAMNVKQVGVTAGSGLAALLVTRMAATHFEWRGAFLVAGGLAVVAAVGFALGYRGTGGAGSFSRPRLGGLFDVPAYRALVLTGFFLGAAVFSTTGYVVLHVTESVRASAGFAGLVLALVQVSGSVGRLGSGALADRLPWSSTRSTAYILVAQTALSAVGFVGISLADAPLTSAVAFGALGLFILGFPGIYYACMTAIVPDDEVGAATAGGQTTLNLGGLLAPPVFGYLADHVSYDAGWLFLAGCATVGAFLALRIVAGE